MTNGLTKGRMTYFHENGMAFQAFNTRFGKAWIGIYTPIDHQYVNCAEVKLDQPIDEKGLEQFAKEYEQEWLEVV